MKAILATAFLASTLAAVGCASHDNSDYSDQQQPNSVGVSQPSPNADPNNPSLNHKGVSQTSGDMGASSTSGNGNK